VTDPTAVTDPPALGDPAAWSDFAVATAGAAAALAGLLFVALSINISSVVGSPHTTARAASALVLLASPVFLALAVLVPWGATVLGVVLVVLAVAVGAGLAVMLPRPIPEVPLAAWLLATVLPPVVLVVGTLLAGVGLLAGGLGGLVWLAPAIGFALGGGLVGAWVLLVEILR
jgi:modulator of FtsH protease